MAAAFAEISKTQKILLRGVYASLIRWISILHEYPPLKTIQGEAIIPKRVMDVNPWNWLWGAPIFSATYNEKPLTFPIDCLVSFAWFLWLLVIVLLPPVFHNSLGLSTIIGDLAVQALIA